MAGSARKTLLIRGLIEEASDIDLIWYLARTEGPALVKDLLECIADAHCLSEDDLWFNLNVIIMKKKEAAAHPMTQVLRRLTSVQPDHHAEPLARPANGTAVNALIWRPTEGVH